MASCSVLLTGCLWHRGPRLPASIPSVHGTPQTAFALQYIDVVNGSGTPMAPRKCVYAHYTGWLTNGKQFDSSHDTTSNKGGEPLSFPQGARRVIAGWDLGFEGMRVGGKRRLFIPYQLAYGEIGRPPVIPARSELIFDVELMGVADTLPEPRPSGATAPRCPDWKRVSGR
jgi:peptidylprolyl isomerase